MMHCTMDDLLALRDGEGSVWARRHAAECAACRDELDALHQRVARLKALPALAPARDRWPAVRDVLAGERRVRRRRTWLTASGMLGAAAAAAIAGLLLVRAPTPSMADELAQTKERSASLEAQLQAYGAHERVQTGREAALAAELEDRIAVIDGALAQAAREAERLNLWRQRVDLMEQLYSVRVTRAAYVGL